MATGGHFDEVLVAAQANAGWAFERLYASLAPAVSAYVRMQCGRDAEDITSEVFLSAFTRIGAFGGDEASFRRWVFTIAHHRVVDARRAQARRPSLAHEPASAFEAVEGSRTARSAEDVAIEGMGADRVRTLLAGLSPEQRDVIALRVIADLPVEQVAQLLGKRPGAIRALQHRAIAALRRELASAPVTT